MSDRPTTEPRTEAGQKYLDQPPGSLDEWRTAILAIEAEAAQGAAPQAEGPTDHVTDLDDPLACWCGPYRDTEEPNVIIHRKEAEA